MNYGLDESKSRPLTITLSLYLMAVHDPIPGSLTIIGQPFSPKDLAYH